MSISKTMLICLLSVMFAFGVSCAGDNASKKKVEKADTSVEKTVKTEKTDLVDVAELTEQKTCPIMGGSINKSLYVDKDGKRIYMCCSGCTAQITSNFDLMIERLKEMGQKPETL